MRKKQRRRERPRRQPLALTALWQLGPAFYPVERCQRLPHFLDRQAERNFSETQLRLVWSAGEWREDPAEAEHFRINHERWQVVLLIEEETPKLKTVKYVADDAA